jgi:ribonuclease D
VIDTPEQLARILPEAAAQSVIALDTEADSLHAYPEKLCLIQLSWQNTHLLVDPLAGLELTPLFEVLRSKELILHGADYDLRLLYRTYEFIPQTVFDTMWAARLLGEREFGLRDLVQRHLGISLEKGPQKMNWALRPLTERMTRYAQNDTRHLSAVAESLRARLKEAGRLEWLQEACARLIEECSQARHPDPEVLWRVKGSDRLDRPAMAVLRELWHWREAEARAANKPPYFVLSHEHLLAVAAAVTRGKPVQHVVPRHVSSNRVARMALAIDRGLKLPATEHPQPRRNTGQRLSSVQQVEFDRLKGRRDRRALELGIDPTLIASKADLVSLVKNPDSIGRQLLTWQRELLEKGL